MHVDIHNILMDAINSYHQHDYDVVIYLTSLAGLYKFDVFVRDSQGV